jgi:DNA-binding NarL/FixJ family response regulator
MNPSLDRNRILRSIHVRDGGRDDRRFHPDAGVPPTRIVLVDMPRVLRDIVVAALVDEPDLEIVGGQGGTLGQTVASSQADFVIAGADYDFAEVARVLDERPRLRVLAVAGHGREAFLYELRPTRTPLGEVSPRAIVEAIRSARIATS